MFLIACIEDGLLPKFVTDLFVAQAFGWLLAAQLCVWYQL